MRAHDHDTRQDDPLRPKAARVDEGPDPAVLRAAASGRRDVLAAAGLLQLQRKLGNAGTSALVEDERVSPVLGVVGRGGGNPLAEPVRADMEARLGADFSDVRVHSDTAAHESARAVGAHAYTVGSDVVFQHGRYDPSSQAGRTMLAHELTHVIQQRSGPVDGTATGDGVQVSDPSDRFERAAAENADRVMAQPVAAPDAHASSGHGVQRAAAEEEELQLARDPSVQRDADESNENENEDAGADSDSAPSPNLSAENEANENESQD